MTLDSETRARKEVEEAPRRVQLSRAKGWRMPVGAIRCARPGPHGNPFRIGGYFCLGGSPDAPRFARQMSYCESLRGPEAGFTLIETNEQAVEWFRRYVATWGPQKVALTKQLLAGHDLACFCALDQPCHADVLLELANKP